MTELSTFLLERQTLHARLTGALVYPCVLLGLGIGVVVFLMSTVIPQLLAVLIASGKPLPASTVLLKSFSDALLEYGWLMLGGGVLLGAGVGAFVRTERQLYMQSFPGRPIPPGIALRIASERIRLEGLTRSASPEDTRNSLFPAQTVPEELRHLIAAIPTDVRLFVQDLQLDDRHLTLRDTARSHAEAERIASALRGAQGWVPSPPRRDVRRGGGVGFSLHAQRGTDEPNDQATAD